MKERRLFAWTPLHDCLGIEEVLWHTEHDDEHPEWRTYWVAGVALLRSVGHILHNVDRKRDEKLRDIIEFHWRRISRDRRQNSIFWDFVDDERNAILKEYRFGVSPSAGTYAIYGAEVADEVGGVVSELFHERNGELGVQLFSEAVL